jgi:YcaO cyclodehydratase, ATP-ad Mg2+-binding
MQGALFELLQVDATTGHWYSGSVAPRLLITKEETPRYWRFLHTYSEYFDRSRWNYEYYWMRQPEDISVYTVACVARSPHSFPALMIGHGVSTDLERAMYRALYEAIPISLLIQIQVLRKLYADPDPITGKLAGKRRVEGAVGEIFQKMEIENVTDLESAVAYYAIPENARTLLSSHFDADAVILPSEIYDRVPPKWKDKPAQNVVFDMLHDTARHHRIYWMDLKSSDMDSVGIKVVRLYSPDLMSLPLPSYPEAKHPRFKAYGGFKSAMPHPYP